MPHSDVNADFSTVFAILQGCREVSRGTCLSTARPDAIPNKNSLWCQQAAREQDSRRNGRAGLRCVCAAASEDEVCFAAARALAEPKMPAFVAAANTFKAAAAPVSWTFVAVTLFKAKSLLLELFAALAPELSAALKSPPKASDSDNMRAAKSRKRSRAGANSSIKNASKSAQSTR